MQPPFGSSNHDSGLDHPLETSAETVEDSNVESEIKPGTISLNADESAELLRCIGELSKTGMPLDEGLEAFAEEVSQRKLKQAFRQLAKEIRAGGNPLVDHDLSFVRLPKYHQSVLVAGIQSHRLGETLYELLEEENWRKEYWRDLWAALSYPILLAAVTLLVVDLLNVFIMPMIQTQFLSIYEDFELDLSFDPEIFRAPTISWTSFFLLGGVGIFLIPAFLTPAQTALLRRSVPVVGKIFWWYESLDLIIKLRLLVAQNIPTPTALRLLEDAVASRRYAELVPVWAEQMEQGKRLGEVWQVSSDIPSSILPLIRWGESNNSLSEALESAERLLKERLALRRELIRKIGPPVITILVLAALFWAAVRLVVLVSPLIDLIQALT
ncbi:type II secretion system F family protein [Bremerella sp. P1]|uniref:type II secretion system F family protein n=1 Tax=Bremerella sp. P1 TaxID=3026424 RepID=UPI00236846E2|nr:type II secretion system F family protein [Bremerella sp. P1]WDI44945.1 type II secretion system F family protein [Bremerella sp. P1]